MAFTAKDVQTLRERTGCGMMDCKKALTQTEGDMEKAIEFLREKGLAKAAEKAGRVTAEGVVVAIVDTAKKVGAVVEVNAETDFVAKNESFVAFANHCAKAIVDNAPADVDALMACKGASGTIEDQLNELKLAIRENMGVRRFVRYEGDLVSYVHGGGRIGVLVKFDTDVAGKEGFAEYGKDIAMQIAAINPAYLDKESVPADVVEKEKEILIAQIQNDPKLSGKPAQVIEKMVEGRIGKYYKENCLVEQPFVKDGNLTVAQYTQNVAKELGGEIKIVEFVRFEKGEGIEKKECDLASEVAGMIK